MDMDDDLLIVRNILHINMSLCLLIAQVLFLFGIEQIKFKVVLIKIRTKFSRKKSQKKLITKIKKTKVVIY